MAAAAAAAAAGLHYNLAATLNTPLAPFGAFPFTSAFAGGGGGAGGGGAQFARFSSASTPASNGLSGGGGGGVGVTNQRFNRTNPSAAAAAAFADLAFQENLLSQHHPQHHLPEGLLYHPQVHLSGAADVVESISLAKLKHAGADFKLGAAAGAGQKQVIFLYLKQIKLRFE